MNLRPITPPNFGLGQNDNMNMFISMMNNMMHFNNLNNNQNNNQNNNNNSNNNMNNMGMNMPMLGMNMNYMGMMNNNMNNNIMNNNMNNMGMMNNNMHNNIMNNNMNNMGMGMNMFNMMNPMMNPMMFNFNFSDSLSLEPKDIKRKEGLDIKCDIDRILSSNRELENKNKDLQTIINYIPFTIIQDEPKKIKDEPRCVICLSDFEIGEKVSALPCCHSFHTKCLDEWITRNQKCPICKFEVTLKNLLGEDFIKMNLERIEKERIEKEKIEKEKREKERI